MVKRLWRKVMQFDRTLLDMRQWNKLIGKVFYQIHPNNPNEYRTIRMSFNIFADKITPQVSNWVYGVPPEGIEPVNPRVLSSLATFQGQGSIGFH